ncbi:UDP-N-acetylmuramoyl-L-alanyl-D-glutamate--2,6-diaminopimelate ligase [Geothrix sp. PMB-07]|uniref:UDP-N-acetylmuramoyl-L-alanyl-D-glutamate--2, 6-diaminopimelate ligase n=1 Tax=Geothrix sp. PMB-07 TaxID=3068640 RepID=UPI002740D634|nr:UDP-N-acetylmuramoyl-L-alanyl-D-glutamate--2,6-diaminopimelate ligase [Geothrix sp. PMB-07]WLT30198.1 UDP-N-acetylmuramoyl-L-alanyl-D-glutamate--2,6-diaminopimelate ligase [Geothrix sp. PMB-07]
MNLDTLIDGIATRQSGPDVEVVDLSSDSRDIRQGWAFLALKGEKADGAAFVPQALALGASAVLSEAPVEVPDTVAACTFLADPRLRMAEMARRLHGTPDEHLALIGVTGTNGKTTTTTLIRQLLRGAGIGCGLVGTVLNAAGDQEEEAVRTTPESPAFYRWLRRSVEAGDAASAVEVSSHALCLGRVHGALFKVGVFTNLTQDHLDYHGTLEAYFQAKASLRNQCGRFLVNADDAYGRRLLEGGRCWSYAIDHEADYRATELELGPTGTCFRLQGLQGDFRVESPLLGRFNAYNLLAALAACAEAGFDLNQLLPAVAHLTGAPGRLERVDCGQPFGVMVDYAHTPDALEKLLAEGRRLLPPGARLHVLFGCGGDRDRAKRPLMAAAVAAGADVLWHTSDNPRSEDPERILDDAAPGIPEALRNDASRYHRHADRRATVAQALADCRPGDLLLLAGKGHEPYQEIHGVKHPYSDRAAVEAALGSSQ